MVPRAVKFEAWTNPDETELTVFAADDDEQRRSQLREDSLLMYVIEAATWEEAMAVHHIRQGWEPYDPGGEAAPCPNGCGALYYPQGSGMCRICGRVS